MKHFSEFISESLSVTDMSSRMVELLDGKGIDNDAELNANYGMEKFEAHTTDSGTSGKTDGKWVRVDRFKPAGRSYDKAAVKKLAEDLVKVSNEMNRIVVVEGDKMPESVVKIFKEAGFTVNTGRKYAYELPTLTRVYYGR